MRKSFDFEGFALNLPLGIAFGNCLWELHLGIAFENCFWELPL